MGLNSPGNVGQQTASYSESKIASWLVFDPASAAQAGVTRDFIDPQAVARAAQTAVSSHRIDRTTLEQWSSQMNALPSFTGFNLPSGMMRLPPRERLAIAACLRGDGEIAYLTRERPTPEAPSMVGATVADLASQWEQRQKGSGVSDDQIQIRRTLAWLDAKYTTNWPDAVKAYNGSGSAADAYRTAVMARVEGRVPLTKRTTNNPNGLDVY